MIRLSPSVLSSIKSSFSAHGAYRGRPRGGSTPGGRRRSAGQVLPPHVFVDVKNEMQIAQDEMFGPIAPIIKVNGEAEALRVANDTQYGLSSAVFTRDQERGVRFALGVQAGMTHVNDHSVDDTPTGPFGGEKNSGIGTVWRRMDSSRIHQGSLDNHSAFSADLSILKAPVEVASPAVITLRHLFHKLGSVANAQPISLAEASW